MASQHQLAKSLPVWVTRLSSLSHPPLSIWRHRVTCLPPKMRVLHEAVLARDDWPLLYDKLAMSNTYSHAKNRSDLCPITLSKVSMPEVGFSVVTILGGGWLQSPASDGPPWLKSVPNMHLVCIKISMSYTTIWYTIYIYMISCIPYMHIYWLSTLLQCEWHAS